MTPSSSLFPLWPRPSQELDKCPPLTPKGRGGHLLQPLPFRGEEIRQTLQQLPLVLKLWPVEPRPSFRGDEEHHLVISPRISLSIWEMGPTL